MEKEKQLKFDTAYMNMAKIWSNNSHCRRKQVGVLIVKDGMIISDGFNGTPSGMNNCCEDAAGETLWYTIHAESNALMKLATGSNSSNGATLYTTLSPCRECSKLILQAGIHKVVYLAQHSDSVGLQLLQEAGVQVVQLIDVVEFGKSSYDYNDLAYKARSLKSYFINKQEYDIAAYMRDIEKSIIDKELQ